MCLLYAAIFGIGTVLLPLGAYFDTAHREALTPITGQIVRISRTNRPKAGLKLNIDVREAEQIHYLTQDDLTNFEPKLASLILGDTVSVLARHDFLWRDLDWYWEIRRGDEMILSYEETSRFLELQQMRLEKVAKYMAGLAGTLLIVAVGLRKHYGAWSSAT
jgi:hypothetical protein